ncbi:chemotaxis protein CheX [Proteinivorax tanatarense]|uniref:Chemotaxis protein CheX n=1 Tax=Proteinivorax tanatarense TaxID=1260629 RepID=A0AAU7VI30_9FIRM
MDSKIINPFITAFTEIMPQLGFVEVKRGDISLKSNTISTKGVAMNIGLVGDVKGNVIYNISEENAKKIASKMMMGAPVEELNEMSQSALSELGNMLTANASTQFSNSGIETNISTPTLMYGEDFKMRSDTKHYICIEMEADGLIVEVNVAVQ